METKEEKKKVITQDDIMKMLDTCYQKATHGIAKVSPPIEQLAEDYLSKNKSPEEAAKDMINKQILKCTTSGFITGFGGLITLPVSIPANIGSVLYVQIRMIACTAYMAGYDLNSDQIQTLVYSCLAGISVGEIFKQFGIKLGEKLAMSAIKKVPSKVLVKINQRIGFRFLTKFGEKGLINMGKLVPGVGALINGGIDLIETKAIGNRAYKMFFNGDLSVGDKLDDDIEITEYDEITVDDLIKEYNR